MPDIRKEKREQWPAHFEKSHVAEISEEAVIASCQKAVAMKLGAVFCSPYQLSYVRPIIQGSGVELALSISFPRGIDTPKIKAYAAEQYAKEGADSLDFVMNYRALKEGYVGIVNEEVKLLRQAVPEVILKMIVEVCELTDEQIDVACAIGAENNIEYIKSSTGALYGPTFSQVKRMAKNLQNSNSMVKVAGVKFPQPQNALMYILAGAERVGSRNAFEIIDGLQELKEAGVF